MAVTLKMWIALTIFSALFVLLSVELLPINPKSLNAQETLHSAVFNVDEYDQSKLKRRTRGIITGPKKKCPEGRELYGKDCVLLQDLADIASTTDADIWAPKPPAQKYDSESDNPSGTTVSLSVLSLAKQTAKRSKPVVSQESPVAMPPKTEPTTTASESTLVVTETTPTMTVPRLTVTYKPYLSVSTPVATDNGHTTTTSIVKNPMVLVSMVNILLTLYWQ